MKKILIGLLLLLSSVGWGALVEPTQISLSASVNKTTLSQDDELILTVTVDGMAGQFNPQLPSLPAFNIYARSSSRQIHNFHASTTFEYIMIPRFAGKTEIGPVTLSYGGKTYKTEPIAITVYRSSQNTPSTPARTTKARAQVKSAPVSTAAAASKPTPQAARPSEEISADMPLLERELYQRATKQHQSYFMVAAVDNTAPYVNQTFTMAVRFYYNAPFSDNAPYTAPALNNLFMEELSRSEGRQNLNGMTYHYIEIRYAVTAVMAGAAEIGSASITYVPVSGRDFSLFDRMFAMVSQEPQTAQSSPIKLQVRPVPTQDQPASFYGAVGSAYTIMADIDRERVEAGEAVNLTVKVNGSGNLKSTSDLKFPQLPGFKTYDAASTSGAVSGNGNLKSYKIFKTVLVPLSSGKYTIPAISWSYYDPVKRSYQTLRTQPLSLEVTPSSQTDTGFDFTSQTDLGSGFQELGQDIHYLKSAAPHPYDNFLSRVAQLHWLTYLALLLLVWGAWFALADKNTLANKRSLAKVRASLKNPANEQAISDALALYLQLTYGITTGSLTLREIEQQLKQKGCADPLIKQFAALWQQLDTVRFAPVALQGQSTQALAQQALQLLKAMDKEK